MIEDFALEDLAREEGVSRSELRKAHTSDEYVENVKRGILAKFGPKGDEPKRPALLTPNRLLREGIARDYYGAKEALRKLSGKRIGGHRLVPSGVKENEWWWGCDEFTIQTHLIKYGEERILEDLGIRIPPISEFSISLDRVARMMRSFEKHLPILPLSIFAPFIEI